MTVCVAFGAHPPRRRDCADVLSRNETYILLARPDELPAATSRSRGPPRGPGPTLAPRGGSRGAVYGRRGDNRRASMTLQLCVALWRFDFANPRLTTAVRRSVRAAVCHTVRPASSSSIRLSVGIRPSVGPSVRPSVRSTMHRFHYESLCAQDRALVRNLALCVAFGAHPPRRRSCAEVLSRNETSVPCLQCDSVRSVF